MQPGLLAKYREITISQPDSNQLPSFPPHHKEPSECKITAYPWKALLAFLKKKCNTNTEGAAADMNLIL